MPREVIVRKDLVGAAVLAAVAAPATIGFCAWHEAAAGVTVTVLWALLGSVFVMLVGPWRVEIDADRVRAWRLFPRTLRWRDVDRVVPSSALGESSVAIRPRGWWRSSMRLRTDHATGPRVLGALQRHAPAGVYRITRAEETVLLGWDAQRRLKRARSRRPVSAARLATYRESAASGTFIALSRALPAEQRLRNRAWIVAGVGACAIAWATLVDGRAITIGPACVVTILLVIRALPKIREHAVIRAQLRSRLGDRVRLDARGMLVSEDGAHRLRQLAADLDDAWMGLHHHVEELGADGATVTSEAFLGPDLGLPAEMRPFTVREAAFVRGVRGSAYAAPPGARPPEVELVVVDHGADGALLRRFGPRARALGDTFHEDASAARAQAAREMWIAEWRELATDADPWSIAAAASDRAIRA